MKTRKVMCTILFAAASQAAFAANVPQAAPALASILPVLLPE